MGLRHKLSAYVVGLTSLVLIGWSLVLSHSAVRSYRGAAVTSGQRVLDALSGPMASALAQRDMERADQALDDATRVEAVTWIGVVDDQGRFLSHSNPRMSESLNDEAWVLSGIQSGDSTFSVRGQELLVTNPVTTGGDADFGGVRWGTLVASFSLVQVDKAIAERRLFLAVASILVVLITGASAYWALSGLVMMPVRDLHNAALRIKEGDLSVHVEPAASEGELRLLAQVFNEMAAQLRDHTAQLEGDVSRRNVELESANKELGQINERLVKALARLADQANTDGLTGLLNHRRFQEKLTLELQRCLRQEHPLSVLMIDVDHFKAYNDYHGHPRGDEVLRNISRVFRDNLRELDMVARYGGEEFGVLLLDTPKGAAALVAEKLRASVQEAAFAGEEASQPSGDVTISVGVASFPEDGLSPVELLDVADKALYRAKALGRNVVVKGGEV